MAALASIVVMSLKITTNKSGFGEYVTYKTVLKDASGIFEKSSIKVAGINAGRIKSKEHYRKNGTGRPTKKDRRDIDEFGNEVKTEEDAD